MLHLPTAIVRWGDASFRPLADLYTEPATGFSPQDDLSCFCQPTKPAGTRQKCLVHAEHEILIFLHFKYAGGQKMSAGGTIETASILEAASFWMLFLAMNRKLTRP
jgi:hypothetical protein